MFFVTGIFAANAAMFAQPLLGYARGSLTISEASVIKTGIVRSAEINRAELTEICWDAQLGGTIRLRSSRTRFDVYLPSYEPETWGRITELLRWWAPASFQHGWDDFCYKIALPQRELDEGRPLRDDETLLTRAGKMWTTSSVFLFAAAAFAARGWWLGEKSSLGMALFVFVFGLILWPPYVWFTIPAKGQRITGRMNLRSIGARPLWFVGLAMLYAATFLLIAVVKKLSTAILISLGIDLAFLAVWLLIRLPELRKQRRDHQRDINAAAEEWERLEREGGD